MKWVPLLVGLLLFGVGVYAWGGTRVTCLRGATDATCEVETHRVFARLLTRRYEVAGVQGAEAVAVAPSRRGSSTTDAHYVQLLTRSGPVRLLGLPRDRVDQSVATLQDFFAASARTVTVESSDRRFAAGAMAIASLFVLFGILVVRFGG